MRRLLIPVLLAATAMSSAADGAPRLPLPAGAHNCYPSGKADNGPLAEALALGIGNIEIDLGWDEARKRLIVGHDAKPREGTIYPELRPYLVPALDEHWKNPEFGQAPIVLTVDWKTAEPEAVRQFKAFLDEHPDWFSTARKTPGKPSPMQVRRLTVCLSGSDAAKDVYDSLIPANGEYRAFRDRVLGQGTKFEDDVSSYVPAPATSYHRFLAMHWSVVERGGPFLAGEWSQDDADRLGSLVAAAHRQGFRLRLYCLNGHTGIPGSGYRFASDAAATVRWLACVKAGLDWAATDEYAAIAKALPPAPELHRELAPAPAREPLLRVADLNIGESVRVKLSNGEEAAVRLDGVEAFTDPIRKAVRGAKVSLTVNGQPAAIGTGNYELPRTVGSVQADCPVVAAYNANSGDDHWGLVKDARIRLWPAGSPWIEPRSFVYPARQSWFATMTQMANEPVYVDGGEVPKNPRIYYHSGLDIGGAEGRTEVIAAADALVVSAGLERLPGHEDSPVSPRYDVIYLLDERGWYYRYSHMKTIDAMIKPGVRLKQGQLIGLLGKEGGSGGWTHLHFEIKSKMPSGRWGIQEGYAFLWQAAMREQAPDLVAAARPHHFVRVGDTVALDGSKSWARSGAAPRFEWTWHDGSKANTALAERTYEQVGSFCETLKVTDDEGHVSYDFAVVQVIDPARPEALPPTIHAAFAPTREIAPGDEVTFKVRTFRVGEDGGHETWDFGDGSPSATTQSDGNARQHAPDGYATIGHRYEKPGDYLVTARRSNASGMPAAARLHVRVNGPR